MCEHTLQIFPGRRLTRHPIYATIQTLSATIQGWRFIFMKDYKEWNLLKQKLENSNRSIYFHSREVWWCAIGVNIGVEIDGKNMMCERPVLIVKRFNRQMFWGVPLTSKEKIGLFYQKINHAHGQSWGTISQLRLLSCKRLIRKIGMIPVEDFTAVNKLIISIINRTPSNGGSRRPTAFSMFRVK